MDSVQSSSFSVNLTYSLLFKLVVAIVGMRETERERMDGRIYEAAITGNVSLLQELLQEDELVLDKVMHDCMARNNPLHIGAQFGHVGFVREILNRKPEFGFGLNSQGLSPLHLASAKGHVQVVKELLKTNPDVCLVHDRDGRTPLHTAAMKGRTEVLKELIPAKRVAALFLTDKGHPILHLCVNHNRFEALKLLVELVDDKEFVNLKDDDDNTVLHLAVAKEQVEVVEFLVNNNSGIDVNAMNVDGYTAVDITLENPDGSQGWKLRGILRNAGAKRGKDVSPFIQQRRIRKEELKNYHKWLTKTKDTLMVVAILLATVTFQAALNPPGSVWQESDVHHQAGEAIMSYKSPFIYTLFSNSNLIGFFASLTIIILSVSGYTLQKKVSIWILMFTTWIAVSSMLVSYAAAFYFLTADKLLHKLPRETVPLTFTAWLVLLWTLIAVLGFRFLRRYLWGWRFKHFFQVILLYLGRLEFLEHVNFARCNDRRNRIVELKVEPNP